MRSRISAWDVLLGGGGEALDGRDGGALLGGELLDATGGIQVVGPEVVARLGQAVGLVEDPAADLPVAHRLVERAVADLLRRDVQQRHVAGADPLQDRAALRLGEQAVQGRDVGRAGLLAQVVHRILHQGREGREDDGEQAAPLVAHQGR
jgi:hypothetical protein